MSNLNIPKYISLLIALILLALGIGTCGVYISYNDPVVRGYSYENSKITEPVKVVVLTDLHGNQFGEGNAELLQIIEEQQADAVFMVGDFLNKYDKEHGEVIELVDALMEIAPVYYALGNHEQQYMKHQGEQLLQDITEAGAELLELSYQDIELTGSNTWSFSGKLINV